MRGLTNYVLIPLTFIGALNWGLIGIFGFDLVAFLFGPATLASNIVYAILDTFASPKQHEYRWCYSSVWTKLK